MPRATQRRIPDDAPIGPVKVVFRAEYFSELVRSEQFGKTVRRSLGRSKDEGGREFGFGILKDLYTGRTVYTVPVPGLDYNNTVMNHDIKERQRELGMEQPSRIFLNIAAFHNHPPMTRVLTPSGSDLFASLQMAHFNYLVLSTHFVPSTIIPMVPRVDFVALNRSGVVEVLMYQKKIGEVAEDHIRYKSALDMIFAESVRNQDEVVHVLNEEGYMALLLPLTRDGRIRKGDAKLLGNTFAFEIELPRMLSMDKIEETNRWISDEIPL